MAALRSPARRRGGSPAGEYGIFDDPMMMLLARPPGGAWRVVQIPIDLVLGELRVDRPYLQCYESLPPAAGDPPCQPDQDGVLQQRVTMTGSIGVFHWFQVIRNTSSYKIYPHNANTLGTPATPAAGGAGAPGTAGLYFAGLPLAFDNRFSEEFRGRLYDLMVFNRSLFIPLDQIPAIADIAHGPIEWGMMGIRRAWLVHGDISGSFDFDLYVECPNCQPSAQQETTANNCQLPSAI